MALETPLMETVASVPSDFSAVVLVMVLRVYSVTLTTSYLPLLSASRNSMVVPMTS